MLTELYPVLTTLGAAGLIGLVLVAIVASAR